MFFAGLGGTAGASMPQAGASSQAPANQRAASSLTTATYCSSRNVTAEGPCESLESARLLAFTSTLALA